jgi:hypothetical protein
MARTRYQVLSQVRDEHGVWLVRLRPDGQQGARSCVLRVAQSRPPYAPQAVILVDSRLVDEEG